MQFTVGSLFAGIGGIDLGFERAGFKTAWQVEIDPWCRKVLAKHFPDAERFDDVRAVGLHNLSPVDVIVGGFPCQDISNAGKRAGITGERSGLWTEYARIIREIRPRFVFVENVAALLGRGMDVVLGDLAEIGYDTEWECVSAADVGAPHLRERIWILAYSRCTGIYERGRNRNAFTQSGFSGRIARNELQGKRSASSPCCCEELADSGCARCPARGIRGRDEAQGEVFNMGSSDGCDSVINISHTDFIASIRSAIARRECGDWAAEPAVGRVAHGIPRRVDRLRGLGNAVVPQIPELFARRIHAALTDTARTVRA